MNALSPDTVGLMRREFRDVHAVVSRMDSQVRQLVGGRAGLDRPGGLVARAAVCAVIGHAQSRTDDDIQRELFPQDRELASMVLRAVASPANSTVATWAAELVQTITQDVSDRLIPQSVLIRLRALGIEYALGAGLIKVPAWAPTATGGFVLEGGPIPVAAFVFTVTTLGGKKAANIIAVTDEMLLGSPADVETTLRTILSESLGLMIDGILLDANPATAARPAGLLNGVTPLTATAGGGLNALLGDVKQLTGAIAPALKPVLIAGAVQAASLGVLAPNATAAVLVSPTLTAGTVIAVDAAAFASALGVPSFRASQHVTLHMDTAATALSAVGSPATVAAPMRSAFQSDVTALRTIIPVDWSLRRSGAVAVLTGATW
jgi:hypothetical protein